MNLKQKVHLGQMYTTGQPLSRGIIGSRLWLLLRHSIQCQNLPGHDERTVQMIPFTDLRDGHLEMVGNKFKRIAAANSVVISGGSISLISPDRTIGSYFLCRGPIADS